MDSCKCAGLSIDFLYIKSLWVIFLFSIVTVNMEHSKKTRSFLEMETNPLPECFLSLFQVMLFQNVYVGIVSKRKPVLSHLTHCLNFPGIRRALKIHCNFVLKLHDLKSIT